MDRMAWVIGMMSMMAAPLGCAAPSSSDCEGSACEQESESSGDGASTGGSASATAGPTTAMTTADPSTTDAPEDTGAPATASDEGTSGDSSGPPPAVCPAATHTCIGPAPDDWSGPFVRRSGVGEGMPPNCLGAYPVDEGAHLLDPISPPQTCQCSCGNVNGASCSTTIRHSLDNTCTLGDPTISLTNNNCINITDTGDDYWMLSSVVSGGTCAAQSTVQIPDVDYAASVRLCGTDDVEAGCDGEDLCLPIPASPLQDIWCIVREGEHECPADGPYTEGDVRFTSFDDTRGCSACSCGAATGSCTGYAASLYTDNTCPIGSFGGSVDGTCTLDTTSSAPTIRAVRRTGVANLNVSCASSGGSATGALTPEDPITICCTG